MDKKKRKQDKCVYDDTSRRDPRENQEVYLIQLVDKKQYKKNKHVQKDDDIVVDYVIVL